MTIREYLKTSSGAAVYERGATARREGLALEDNPFPERWPLRHSTWNLGYQDETNMKSSSLQLYEVDGKYVTRIATNSLNLAVVEERGTGLVFTCEPEKLKKVIPYTVTLLSEGVEKHFIAKPGQVADGDLLISGNGVIARVIKVNSEVSSARVALGDWGFRRLVTEALTG